MSVYTCPYNHLKTYLLDIIEMESPFWNFDAHFFLIGGGSGLVVRFLPGKKCLANSHKSRALSTINVFSNCTLKLYSQIVLSNCTL